MPRVLVQPFYEAEGKRPGEGAHESDGREVRLLQGGATVHHHTSPLMLLLVNGKLSLGVPSISARESVIQATRLGFQATGEADAQ